MKKMDSQTLVIFGASGDLTERKLVPAIFHLYKGGLLPENFAVLGVSRTEFTDESFREKVVWKNEQLNANAEQEELTEFAKLLHYQPLSTKDADSYPVLKDRLEKLKKGHKLSDNLIFYLSTPPSLFEIISHNLSELGLISQENGWKRVIIEKPFGYDLESAKQLNLKLHQYLTEDQLYRIDHYLGKETVQNILVSRFSNTIFEPIWNRNFIHHVEITSAENSGVGNRGGYYDHSGALRDMIQNHLLQLVGFVAMEPPISISPKYIRDEQVKLFKSLRKIKPEEVHSHVIRGQYIASNIKGKQVKGYRQEKGVPEDSETETYCAIKFFIDNWRWAGVPFYIRTGKYLPTKVTEIVIHFKPMHYEIFEKQKQPNSNNMLIIRIQPNEGIKLKFGLKVPGEGFNVTNVGMDFHYSDLTDAYMPEAYERLLLDCMQGDSTLYTRGDAVEAAWEFADPILKAWKNDPSIKMYGYPAGSWGPEPADSFIEGKHVTWRYPCKNLTDDDTYCEL